MAVFYHHRNPNPNRTNRCGVGFRAFSRALAPAAARRTDADQ